MIARTGEAAKLPFPVHPHMLRHSTGYKLANDGHDTRALQHYMGHKNIMHTVRYTEMAPDRFKNWQPRAVSRSTQRRSGSQARFVRRGGSAPGRGPSPGAHALSTRCFTSARHSPGRIHYGVVPRCAHAQLRLKPTAGWSPSAVLGLRRVHMHLPLDVSRARGTRPEESTMASSHDAHARSCG